MDYLINGPFEWQVVLKINENSLEKKVSFEKKAILVKLNENNTIYNNL